MTQDDTAGGTAPTHTAMDITPKPGAADVPASPPAPVAEAASAVPEAAPAVPAEPTRTAMDITPDREA